jgi:hypothetical protein
LHWELMRQGRMRPDDVFMHESRHVITRSLGPEPTVQIDIEGPYPIFPGDVYLLCSDGLTGHVQDAEIGIIARELPPQEACRLLVNLANLRGGSDNISVVAVQVGNAGEHAEPEEETSSSPRGMAWGWLLAIWFLALLFVSGVTGILIGRAIEGVYLVAFAAFGAVGAFAYWLETRPRKKPPDPNLDGTETTVWKPYRTASARSSAAFLNHLASLQIELQRAATEEHWTIDWPAYEAAYATARASLEAQDYSKALAELAKVLEILMAGLMQYRKQLHRQSKWGKPPSPQVEKSGG